MITAIHEDMEVIVRRISELDCGDATPALVATGRVRGSEREMTPYALAHPWQRQAAVREEIQTLQFKLRDAAGFVRHLQRCIQRHHGNEPRRAVSRGSLAVIAIGERRLVGGWEVTVTKLDRREIWWIDPAGWTGRCSARTWRAYPLVSHPIDHGASQAVRQDGAPASST